MGRHNYSYSGNTAVSTGLAAVGLLVVAGVLYLMLSLHGSRREALAAEAALMQAAVVLERGEALLRSGRKATDGAELAEAGRELRDGLERMRPHAARLGASGLIDELGQSVEAWRQALRSGDVSATEIPEARARVERALESLAQTTSRLTVAKERDALATMKRWQAVTLVVGIGVAALLGLVGLLFARKASSASAEASACRKAVELERARLEGLLRRLPVPLLRTSGPEHRINFANAPLRMLCPERQIIGEPLRALAPQLCQAWERVFTTGQSLSGQQAVWRLQRDGVVEPVHLNLWLEPVRGRGGAVEGVLAIATDVTSLVEARGGAERLQALAASLSRSATATELAEGILAQCLEAFGAEDGLVALVSAQSPALQVQAARGLIPPKYQVGCTLPLDRAGPLSLSALSGELVVVGSREQLAERFPSMVSEAAAAEQLECGVAVPVLLEGRKLGVIGLAFQEARRFGDSDRALMMTAGRLSAQAFERVSLFEAEKRARAEAERAIDVRDEFLSVASHELKTPLTVVQMQLRRALRFRGEGNAERLSVALKAAERSAARLGRLIDNMLDVSQVRSDNLMLELERVDLFEALRDVAERFRDELDRSGSELRLETHGEISGLWDRLRIEQIASSLLSNAIKFGLGEPIHVEAARRGDQAWLTVRDGGLGIAQEDRQRIFRRFERAVSVHHFGGFGLGLWLTRQSVEALGGTIEVQSELGVSSTFVVTLPCAGPAASLSPGPAAPAAS